MVNKRLLKNVAIGLANLLLFAALFRWLVDNVRPAELLRHLEALPVGPIVLGIVFNILAVAFSGFRLAILVQRSRSVAFQISNLGFGLNAVLPFRMGELARLHYAKRLFALSAGKLFSAGLVEKYFDLLAIGAMVFWLLIYGNAAYLGRSLMLTVLGAIVALGVVVMLVRKLSWLVDKLASRLSFMRVLVSGLRAHARVHDLWWVSCFTLGIWIANIAAVFAAFAGFLPTVGFGHTDAVVLLLITALAIAIPSAPSGLGVFEAGIVAYLTQSFHIENEMALACAIVFHAMVTAPQVIAMLVIFAGRRPTSPHVGESTNS